MRLAFLVTVFVVFTGWSFTVIGSQGFSGLNALIWREPWALQMFLDLCISLTVAWMWLRDDARTRGILAWPYIVGTLIFGSIAVLAYLIHREILERRTKPQAQ